MLEKILKIIKIINSCKDLNQLEQTLEIIANFERDLKPRDPRIIRDLNKYYQVQYNEIIRKHEPCLE